jgi:hypothetical protein
MSAGGEQELFSSPMMYRLLRQSDGRLALEVVVGGMAMSTVRVELTPDEAAAYAREGQAATDRLAQSISANPSYFGRASRVP